MAVAVFIKTHPHRSIRVAERLLRLYTLSVFERIMALVCRLKKSCSEKHATGFLHKTRRYPMCVGLASYHRIWVLWYF